MALVRASVFFWASMVASTRMHNSMVVRVLRAPLAFFHTNPAGRVLNRFSNDQVLCAELLGWAVGCAVLCCAVLCCAVLCCAPSGTD
jgi:ATP-binding cassette subfamily C (CFTR/MRP) protein 4